MTDHTSPVSGQRPMLPAELTQPSGVSRRSLIQIGSMLALGAGLAPLLAACGVSPNSSVGVGTSAASGKKGGTMTVGIPSTPDTLDPGATGLALTLLISMAIFDPLVWWLPDASGKGSRFVPGLAKSYTVSPDASVYTFKLREDVVFHDGTHFDATAVKATYDHIVDPATQSKSGLGALGPYKETRIIDPYTVEISFTEPNASFLHQQAAGNFGIASPTALKKYGATGFGNHPVGSGPFKFESYATGDRLTLVKNSKYAWAPAALGAGAAKLDKLVFRIITDDSGRYNGLQSGQLNIAMNLPPNDISAASKSSKYRQLTIPAIGTPIGLMINVTKSPTNDPLVRQAILHAVDQDTMVKSVLFGVDTAAHSVLTPITPGYSKSSAELYSFSPSKANALLDKAGWVKGAGGVRSKNGQKLDLDILLYQGSGMELAVQYVVAQLTKVGFAATTSVQPFATAQQTFNAGGANLGSFGYYGADPYLLNIWANSNGIASGFNWAHYANPKMDAALAAANSTANDGARNKAYEAISTTLMKDAVFLPLWDVNGAFTTAASVAGLHPTLNGYLTFHSASL